MLLVNYGKCYTWSSVFHQWCMCLFAYVYSAGKWDLITRDTHWDTYSRSEQHHLLSCCIMMLNVCEAPNFFIWTDWNPLSTTVVTEVSWVLDEVVNTTLVILHLVSLQVFHEELIQYLTYTFNYNIKPPVLILHTHTFLYAVLLICSPSFHCGIFCERMVLTWQDVSVLQSCAGS